MTKIFHIITHFDMGGAERIAYNIVSSDTPNFEYHLFEVVRGTSKFSKSFLNDLENKNIKYHRSKISNKKLAILFFPFWFWFFFLKYKPSIIPAHTEIPDLGVFIFYKLFGKINSSVKYVRTIHNTKLWDHWEKIGRVVERFYIKNKGNVAISLSTKEFYEKKFKVSQVPLIYNGINKTDELKFNEIQPNKLNILFAGRLEYQKGVDELIRVIQDLDPAKYHFFIVGEGSLSDRLHKSLYSYKNKTFLKTIYNLSAYLNSFDYVFMPSNFEGLGILAIEAAFSKTPVILNLDCSGLNETVPNDWPLGVKNNSVDEYLSIFRQLNKKDQELSEKIYSYAIGNFSIERMQNDYENLYLEKIHVD